MQILEVCHSTPKKLKESIQTEQLKGAMEEDLDEVTSGFRGITGLLIISNN